MLIDAFMPSNNASVTIVVGAASAATALPAGLTGVGANPVKHVLNLDSLATGQPVPIGLTPYGNIDLQRWNDSGITWPITWFLGKGCQPGAFDWPTAEAFFDTASWIWLYNHFGYTGDYEFIYFE